jgi:hypothetical protein
MIDGNRTLTESVGMQVSTTASRSGWPIPSARSAPAARDSRVADHPVLSLVHLPGPSSTRLFDTVAPGVPVMVRVQAGQGMDEQVRFELHGFSIVREPFDVLDLVA